MKKKTHQEYEEELFQKEIDRWPIEEYKTAKIPILHECINGHQLLARPFSVLAGHGCLACSKSSPMEDESYLSRIAVDAKPIEGYKGSQIPILHECKLGHKWKASPANILQGHGCRKCWYNKAPGGYNTTRFLNNRELATSQGVLYVVVLVNKATDEKTCVKVGITKGTSNRDVLKRASGFKGYDVRIQKLYKGSLEEVFKLEQEIHSKFSEHSYKSEWKFGGATELFNLDKLSEILNSLPA